MTQDRLIARAACAEPWWEVVRLLRRGAALVLWPERTSRVRRRVLQLRDDLLERSGRLKRGPGLSERLDRFFPHPGELTLQSLVMDAADALHRAVVNQRDAPAAVGAAATILRTERVTRGAALLVDLEDTFRGGGAMWWSEFAGEAPWQFVIARGSAESSRLAGSAMSMDGAAGQARVTLLAALPTASLSAPEFAGLALRVPVIDDARLGPIIDEAVRSVRGLAGRAALQDEFDRVRRCRANQQPEQLPELVDEHIRRAAAGEVTLALVAGVRPLVFHRSEYPNAEVGAAVYAAYRRVAGVDR